MTPLITSSPAADPSHPDWEILRAHPPAGVLLNGSTFLSEGTRTLRTVSEVSALIERIKKLASPPPIIMMDVEGGGGRWDYLAAC